MRILSIGLLGVVAPATLLLSGCYDDRHDNFYGDDGGADPSGVYEGTLTDTVTSKTVNVTGILDENGDGILSTDSGKYFRLNQINTSGNDVSASFTEYSDSGAFANGTLTTTGSLSGQVTTPGLQANVTTPGDNPQTLSLNFDYVYDHNSSLPTLAGTYTSSTTTPTVTLTIGASGGLTGTDSNNCSYGGNFNLIDPNFNAYGEHVTVTCGATTTTYSGLSDFVPASGSGTTTTPASIHLLADTGSGAFADLTLSQ